MTDAHGPALMSNAAALPAPRYVRVDDRIDLGPVGSMVKVSGFQRADYNVRYRVASKGWLERVDGCGSEWTTGEIRLMGASNEEPQKGAR